MFHSFKNTNIIRLRFVKFFFFLLFIISLAFARHKEYYSLTKIHYNKEQKNLEITMRLFIDDLELTLNNRYDLNLELATKVEKSIADQVITSNVEENFALSVNKKPLNIEFVGKEYDKDVVYLYFESPIKESIVSMEVRNMMLFSYYKDQENIVKVDVEGVKKSVILNAHNNKEILKFDSH
jgi:hypothetical protein